eukprot:1186406-Prorocentrum_minimum.AAC.2
MSSFPSAQRGGSKSHLLDARLSSPGNHVDNKGNHVGTKGNHVDTKGNTVGLWSIAHISPSCPRRCRTHTRCAAWRWPPRGDRGVRSTWCSAWSPAATPRPGTQHSGSGRVA